MQNLVSLGLMARHKGDFAIFPYISPCKTCDPQGRGRAKFDPRAIPWALLVEVH